MDRWIRKEGSPFLNLYLLILEREKRRIGDREKLHLVPLTYAFIG